MHRKSIITIILVGLITLVIAIPASWAGSRTQHRMEGVVIAIGTMVLAKAIIDQHHANNAAYHSPRPCHRDRRPHYRPAGHWEIQKRWVPSRYKKVWNPGHYRPCGKWAPGRWIKIKTRHGHWSKKRVWVST